MKPPPPSRSTRCSRRTDGGDPYTVALDEVTFSYPASDGPPALKALSFRQKAGEMIGIMGASGAGKSTLAKCLNRIVPEFEGGDFRGVVRIGGRDVAGMTVAEVAPSVGMVFQDFESQLFSTNVAHEVAFAMEQMGMAREEMVSRIVPAIEAVGLKGFDHRDPTSLSGGEKQRLAVAAVLALRPSIVVLDEPTTDLDPEGREEVFTLIRRLRGQGLSLIVIEHEAEELRRCDRIVLLSHGELIADEAPGELMTRLDLLEQCGVHPPGLNLLLSLLGIGGHAVGVDDAARQISGAFPRLGELLLQGEEGRLPVSPAKDPAAGSEPDLAPATTLVEIEELSFAYPGGAAVLNSISLTIKPGEFLAIIGQNGSGKTTLAKQIVGLLKPDSGRVMLEGRDRAAMNPKETAHLSAYVFQNPDHQIFAATVEEEVAFGPKNFGLEEAEIEQRVSEVLAAVGLEEARRSDPFLLSKGERQRLAVASMLALRPRLLILDEPTTGLDYREERRMMALVTDLNRSGIAVVMITHTPWLVARYARRAVLMGQGRVMFDGTVRELFADHRLLSGSAFRPPEVTLLGRRFGTVALTPEELAAWLKERA